MRDRSTGQFYSVSMKPSPSRIGVDEAQGRNGPYFAQPADGTLGMVHGEPVIAGLLVAVAGLSALARYPPVLYQPPWSGPM